MLMKTWSVVFEGGDCEGGEGIDNYGHEFKVKIQN